MPEDLVQVCERAESSAYSSLVEAAKAVGFSTIRNAGLLALLSTAAPRTIVVNRVLGWGAFTAPSSDSLVDTLEAYRRHGLGCGIEVIPSAMQGDELEDLKSLRFRRVARSQVLVRRHMRALQVGHGRSSSHINVEEGSHRWTAAVAQLCVESFNVPASVGGLIRQGLRGSGWRYWLAFDNGVPIGTALAHAEEEVGWIGWTSVRDDHRGLGIHAALVARQLEDLVRAGVTTIVTDTAAPRHGHVDASLHNMRKLGFEDAYVRETFVCAP